MDLHPLMILALVFGIAIFLQVVSAVAGVANQQQEGEPPQPTPFETMLRRFERGEEQPEPPKPRSLPPARTAPVTPAARHEHHLGQRVAERRLETTLQPRRSDQPTACPTPWQQIESLPTLRRAIVLSEVLGPPRAVQPFRRRGRI